ncbi:MAG: pentapeptide repeat-containing protein, partial [Nitrospirae bacterium CG06_land_8_20_14_3_00_70_43]
MTRAECLAAYGRGESLADLDLAWIDLAGAQLRGADLADTTLTAAHLEGVCLDDGNLERCFAAEAYLAGASLARVR